MIITFIYSNSKADQYRVQIRCRNFAEAIRRTGYHTAYLVDLESFLKNTSEAQEACQKADLLVIHRHLYGPVIENLLMWKARGKKILVDLDEAIQFMTPDMTGYPFWKLGIPKEDDYYQKLLGAFPIRPIPLEQLSWGLRALDAATMPSVRLADDWSSTVRTHYLPDYINSDQYMIQRANCQGMVTIGVSGCTQSFNQLQKSGLITALENICQQRRNVLIHFFDFEPGSLDNARIPDEQRIIFSDISPYMWPMLLARIDIGIACAEGKFGARTSRIKTVEYSIMKIPWLASNLYPFREMGKYGWLVSNSESQWIHAILEVVDHLDIYQAEANSEPFLYGISQDVFENVDKIISTYETVLNYQ